MKKRILQAVVWLIGATMLVGGSTTVRKTLLLCTTAGVLAALLTATR